ncbi:hypothetical protein H6F74_24790 [Trichocoleus sp. FACHB-90]|uniref:hypothetical protein n=1 Tax=Cyanophyceae TaxID=3028117 RepID=UPI001682D7EB|nr:hypothetical protein [Trichocoleus sp. FACHB-90]MBD1929435.1 hypothetical protein [Trichocoleus sp. FACHB-90]
MNEYTFFAKLRPDHDFYSSGYKFYLPLPPFTSGMNEYIFFAKLRPAHDFYSSGYKFYLPLVTFNPRIIFHNSFISFKVALSQYKSDLIIKVTDVNENLTNEYGFLQTLRNVVKQAVAVIVNTLNYIYKSGFDIEIVRVQLPDGQYIEISSFLETAEQSQSKRPFAELGTEKQVEIILNLLFNPLSTDESASEQAFNSIPDAATVAKHHFAGALTDFREAIIREGYTPLYCYRALENIRRAIVAKTGSSNKDIDKEWKILRKKLVIDECSLIVVTRLAEQNRHAGVCPISGQSYNTLIEFIAQVFDRYVLYLDSGSKDLEESKFKSLILETPVSDFFELQKVKEEIKKYSERYPDESQLFESVEPRNDIQKFIDCINLMLDFKRRENEKRQHEQSSREQESKQKVKVLEKELKQVCNKRDGAIALLKKLKQEPSSATQVEEIERVIALLAEE